MTNCSPMYVNLTAALTYATIHYFKLHRSFEFCVGVCALHSVVGEVELSHSLNQIGRQPKKLKGSMNFSRFANTLYESPGTMLLLLSTPKHVMTIPSETDVVREDIPAALGLDSMQTSSLTSRIVTNTLVKRFIKNKKPVNLCSINLLRR